jgi:phenylacetate-coenzyme A ligase PaaK-like adenylate-forming protein
MHPQISKRLHSLLDHARNNTPYYAGLLPPVGEPFPENIFDYLGLLPLLSKRTIQSNHARFWSLAGDTSQWRRVKTSGTTGEPVGILWDPEARVIEANLFALHVDRCLGSPHWRRGKIFHLTLHTTAASCVIPAIWHQEGQVVKWNIIRAWQLCDARFLEMLSQINGSVLTVMPSVAQLICSRIRAVGSRCSIRPSLMLLSGEMLDPTNRVQFEYFFQCPVTSLYTMAEAGIIAAENKSGEEYLVQEFSAVMEIVDENGNRLPDGCKGEIVVTPLNNFAMPLIRYKTGDYGYWLDQNSSPPSFRLVEGRHPRHLVTSSGSTINIVRFAKLLASMEFSRYRLEQEHNDNISLSYYAEKGPLERESLDLVSAIIRQEIGLDVEVCIKRVSNPSELSQRKITKPKFEDESLSPIPEPLGPNIRHVVDWLKQSLETECDIQAAVIIGSSLDPNLTTRFSDIDLIIFINGDLTSARWSELARHLKDQVPKLSPHVDTLSGLSSRAPLLACRILCEQLPVINRVEKTNLPWPSLETLRSHGIYYAQDTAAILWLKMLDLKRENLDYLKETWMVKKYYLDALRYLFLTRGIKKTDASSMIARAKTDEKIHGLWTVDLDEAIQVAQEFRPPPLDAQRFLKRYLNSALGCIRRIQTYL